jgi:hypothetical protein
LLPVLLYRYPHRVGSVSKGRDGVCVFCISYSHGGLGTRTHAYRIDDIFREMSTYEDKLNHFLGRLFHTLNATLEDEETQQFCGIFNGRIYERFVTPSEARDFNSGRYKSYEWFEEEE